MESMSYGMILAIYFMFTGNWLLFIFLFIQNFTKGILSFNLQIDLEKKNKYSTTFIINICKKFKEEKRVHLNSFWNSVATSKRK